MLVRDNTDNIEQFEINHPDVDNYFINRHSSGIIEITFNTKDRWTLYHRYNDNTYVFSNADDAVQLNIPLEVFNINGKYTKPYQQEKDQITQYFIPLTLIGFKDNNMNNNQIIETVKGARNMFDIILLSPTYNENIAIWDIIDRIKSTGFSNIWLDEFKDTSIYDKLKQEVEKNNL